MLRTFNINKNLKCMVGLKVTVIFHSRMNFFQGKEYHQGGFATNEPGPSYFT